MSYSCTTNLHLNKLFLQSYLYQLGPPCAIYDNSHLKSQKNPVVVSHWSKNYKVNIKMAGVQDLYNLVNR